MLQTEHAHSLNICLQLILQNCWCWSVVVSHSAKFYNFVFTQVDFPSRYKIRTPSTQTSTVWLLTNVSLVNTEQSEKEKSLLVVPNCLGGRPSQGEGVEREVQEGRDPGDSLLFLGPGGQGG